MSGENDNPSIERSFNVSVLLGSKMGMFLSGYSMISSHTQHLMSDFSFCAQFQEGLDFCNGTVRSIL